MRRGYFKQSPTVNTMNGYITMPRFLYLKNPLQNAATFCFCSSKLIQFMHVCALMNTDFLKAVEGIRVLIAWMYDHSSPL